jgi:hypothetical protein
MSRRTIQSGLTLALSLPAAVYFILLPQWEIEHPGDSSLVLRNERHWLWQAPAHSHLDPAAMLIPVLAIGIVVLALLLLIRQAE